jgi:hypothetical protein
MTTSPVKDMYRYGQLKQKVSLGNLHTTCSYSSNSKFQEVVQRDVEEKHRHVKSVALTSVRAVLAHSEPHTHRARASTSHV